ncbi:MAG: hypothetical protein QOI57_1978, partial [Rubrobacteraceae bacterium]|nr:hypothetical protein [Rubrobacteraceae bacterium]
RTGDSSEYVAYESGCGEDWTRGDLPYGYGIEELLVG